MIKEIINYHKLVIYLIYTFKDIETFFFISCAIFYSCSVVIKCPVVTIN